MGEADGEAVGRSVPATIERIHFQYSGHFAAPIFEALGNPARIYSALLRHFASFDVSAKNLSLDASVLDRANVMLLTRHAQVRIWLDRLELTVHEGPAMTVGPKMIEPLWATAREIGEQLVPVRHSITLGIWAQLKDETFSTFAAKFANLPRPTGWRVPGIHFEELDESGAPIGSIQIEESAIAVGNVFLRLRVDLGGGGSVSTEELVKAHVARLNAQMAALGLAFVSS